MIPANQEQKPIYMTNPNVVL